MKATGLPNIDLAEHRFRNTRRGRGLWPAISPTDLQTPENSKTQKGDSKVTFGLPAKMTQELLKSDSKVTKTVGKSNFWVTLSNFWVTLAGSPKVTFESLFCVFEFSGVWGSVGEMAGHKSREWMSNEEAEAAQLTNYEPEHLQILTACLPDTELDLDKDSFTRNSDPSGHFTQERAAAFSEKKFYPPWTSWSGLNMAFAIVLRWV